MLPGGRGRQPQDAAAIARQTRSGAARQVDVAHPEVRERVHDGVLDRRGSSPIDPASPIPFTPSTFTSVGVSVVEVSNVGSSAALGIA